MKVNTDDEPGLARRLNIQQLPGLIFYKDGQEAGRGAGAVGERDLAAWLDYLIAGGARPPLPSGPSVPFGSAAGASAGGSPYAQTHSPQPPSKSAGTGVKSEPMILTDSNFDQVVHQSSVPVLVDFWAVWCGPCKMIAPHVAALAQEYAGRAIVGKLNVDENPRTAGQYGIMSIPTLLIFSEGKVVDQIVGAQPASVLRQRLARHVK